MVLEVALPSPNFCQGSSPRETRIVYIPGSPKSKYFATLIVSDADSPGWIVSAILLKEVCICFPSKERTYAEGGARSPCASFTRISYRKLSFRGLGPGD